jgi:hypothetical protein
MSEQKENELIGHFKGKSINDMSRNELLEIIIYLSDEVNSYREYSCEVRDSIEFKRRLQCIGKTL